MSKVLVVGNRGLTADALESDHPVLVHSSFALVDTTDGHIRHMEVVVDWAQESYLREYKVEVDFECVTRLAGAFSTINKHHDDHLPYDKTPIMGRNNPYVVLPEDYMRLVQVFMGDTQSDERLIVVTPTSEDYDWLEDMGFDALYDNVIPIDFEFFTHAVDNLLDDEFSDKPELVEMLQHFMSLAEDTVYTSGYAQMQTVFAIAVFVSRLIHRIDWYMLEDDLADGVIFDEGCCSSPVHGWDSGAEQAEGKNIYEALAREEDNRLGLGKSTQADYMRFLQPFAYVECSQCSKDCEESLFTQRFSRRD